MLGYFWEERIVGASSVIQCLDHHNPSAHPHVDTISANADNVWSLLSRIRAAIERMDFRWDQGLITDKHKYLEERVKLPQALEQFSPVANNDR
jgi:hypothetical protein